VTVFVCDDRLDQCQEVCEKVKQANHDCVPLCGQDLTTELGKLFATVKLDMNDLENYKRSSESRFDGADIVILDNNLTHLEKEDAPLWTAETIAGYVRAFTKASYIVSLNLNPDVDFDLRFLVGDHSTKADLAINTAHLSNPALWSGDQGTAEDSFLPWYWPQLESVATKRRKQIEFVSKNLREPVVAALGFEPEAIDLLSPDARGALSPEAASDREIAKGGTPFDKLTFRNIFIAKDRSLPFKPEREKLSKAEEDGNAALRDIIARVVAADIDLWFRRHIVGPQEPLVDVPHLLMRFPFLLGKRAGDIGEWNKSVRSNTPPYGFEQNLYEAHLARAEYKQDLWVPNPCFWWPKLKMDDTLNDYFFKPKQAPWADVVFCEDCSEFGERSPKNGDAPAEFSAELEGAWERRHVAHLPGKQYRPLSRFAI